jgi:hypothetical protein
MRDLTAGNLAALQARRVVARDFLWLVVRDRTTGTAVTDGVWSDVGNINCDVIDPETGTTATRGFYGSGTLISISDIPLVSNITVQNVTINISQVADHVNNLVRTYDCKQGKVQVFRGLFDPLTRNLVSPAIPRFVGYIDNIEIRTGKEGGDGGVVLTCVSSTQEMTRANADTRSDASQRLRSATDNFFASAGTAGEQQHFWGRASGAVSGVAVDKSFGSKTAALSP